MARKQLATDYDIDTLKAELFMVRKQSENIKEKSLLFNAVYICNRLNDAIDIYDCLTNGINPKTVTKVRNRIDSYFDLLGSMVRNNKKGGLKGDQNIKKMDKGSRVSVSNKTDRR